MKFLQKIARILGINKKTPPRNYEGNILTSNEKISKETFPGLHEHDRIRVIMRVGDSGNLQDFDIIVSALSDSSKAVKFAALKRIHNFAEHPNTIQLVQSLESQNKQKELEPYYSMALFRLSLISETELNNALNPKNFS